jgi:hypothetical protein
LTIESGETLTVDAFVILVNDGLIENEGKIILNDQGGMGNFGHLVNSGTIYIRPQGAFSNVTPLFSLITNNADGKIFNAGFFSNLNVIGNYGTIENIHPGTFTNAPFGVIYNFGGDIRNSGSFTNDGGIDNEGSFRNQCGVYSGNPPNLNPVETVDCLDSDNDAIDDAVDTLPVTFSNDFENEGGDLTPTSGTIIERGDQIISIIPWGYDETVLISSHPAGGFLSAEYNVCGFFMNFILDVGDVLALECDSADIQVLNGPIDITFTDGTTSGTATLDGGDSILFNPTSFSVTNNGDTPVIIIINGNPITIPPGETYSRDKVVGGIIIPIETTSLLLAGQHTSAVWMIPTLAGLAGAGLYLVKFRANRE